MAASLRWVSLVCLRPEYGPELSQDQDYEYDVVEENAAESVHSEAQQVASGPSVHTMAMTQGPVAQPAGQPASPPPRRVPAQPASDLGR